nr:flagellar hook-basal body protein [Bacillus benzoevorans]
MNTASNTLGQIQKKIDVIGNNIANVNTTGFKKRDAKFTDLLVQQLNNQPNASMEVGRLTPNGIRSGTGAKLAQVQIMMAQGSLKTTDRELDVAFTKEGQYFRVYDAKTEDIMYTRDGTFYLSPLSETEMMLVTGAGNPVLNENNQPIFLQGETKEIQIDKNGHVLVIKADGSVAQNVNLGVTRIDKPQFLEQKGGNLLGFPINADEQSRGAAVTNMNADSPGEIAIQQRALEQSNVDLAKEMTDLMNAQRSYQFQARSMSIADQMMGLINGMR